MKKTLFLFLSRFRFTAVMLSLCTMLFLFQLPHSMSLPDEKQALLEFKSLLKDQSNNLESWNAVNSHCEFVGITCDTVTERVIGITLDDKSLSGEISPSIGTLQSLMNLVLPSNMLSGKLPLELMNCSNLKILNVTGNSMVKDIPDLSVLKELDVSHNYFSGKFPGWVGNLMNLVSLGLGQNDFDESEIPETLGSLKNLTWMFLSDLSLIGEIPEAIFELEALETLDLSKNKIVGKLSSSIGKLHKLNKIELYVNNLTG